jgi:hypothetical protein
MGGTALMPYNGMRLSLVVVTQTMTVAWVVWRALICLERHGGRKNTSRRLSRRSRRSRRVEATVISKPWHQQVALLFTCTAWRMRYQLFSSEAKSREVAMSMEMMMTTTMFTTLAPRLCVCKTLQYLARWAQAAKEVVIESPYRTSRRVKKAFFIRDMLQVEFRHRHVMPCTDMRSLV